MREYLTDVSAERAVIASIFRYGAEGYADVADIVTPSTFNVESNQIIWRCIEHVMKDESVTQIDFPTIMSSASSLSLAEFFRSDADIKHLRSIMNTPVMPEVGRRMAAKIRKFEIATLLERQLDEAKTSIRGLKGDETINEIMSLAEQPIFDFTSLLTDSAKSGPQLMGTDAVAYMQHLMDNPREMIGISTGMKRFDTAIGGGIRPNSLDIIVARMKVGKASPLTSIVYTPHGPRTMGEIKQGDVVCTPNGEVTRVNSIHPQGILDVFRVKFSDGDSAECCGDHLWLVKNRRKKHFEIKSTKDLSTSLMDGPTPRWQVQLGHCFYEKASIPIHPYILGILLGNGGLTNGLVGLTSADEELVKRANAILTIQDTSKMGYRFYNQESREAGNAWVLRGERVARKNIYISRLRDLGLFGCGSHEKFIPRAYLHNSTENRMELLWGLMDTDGSADLQKGAVEYSSTSYQLARDIKELVQSLGGLCTIRSRYTTCNGKRFLSFRMIIRIDDPRDLFALSRKRNRCHKRTKPPLKRTIRSITFLRRDVCQCIKLQDERGLYFTDNHIVTHNTQIVDNVAVHITETHDIPVFNIDTEMSKEEHQVRIVSNLAGVPVRQIETGRCGTSQLDRKKVIQAAERLQSLPYHYECIIGRQFEEVLGSLRRWVTRTVGLNPDGKAKPCVVIYDYLKMLSSDFSSGNMQEHQALGYVTTALKNFMGRYGVGCLCFAQANREGIEKEDTGVVGGSDRIAQYATSVTLYKFKTPEERVEAGKDGMQYTHKLVPIVSRHGEGLQDNDYINIRAEYGQARITEGPTRNELASGAHGASKVAEGFVVNDGDTSTVNF